MSNWEHRANKLEKRRKKSFANYKDPSSSYKDKSKKKEIKEARRYKESVWDNLDSEGDE